MAAHHIYASACHTGLQSPPLGAQCADYWACSVCSTLRDIRALVPGNGTVHHLLQNIQVSQELVEGLEVRIADLFPHGTTSNLQGSIVGVVCGCGTTCWYDTHMGHKENVGVALTE